MTTSAHTSDLQRKLQPRHLSMIAIGGSIGTGLFCCLWCNDYQCRARWRAVGVFVNWFDGLFPDDQLGRNGGFYARLGASYGSHFVDRHLVFTGWNYWYNWASAWRSS